MVNLWIFVVTATLLNNGRASDENMRKQDGTVNQECASELCDPNPLPIPMIQRERTLPEEEAVRRDNVYYGSRLPEGQEGKTNFSCNEKPYIPGFYADMEAECRVFHLCLSSEIDHFFCPPGTAFNQEDLVCENENKVNCHLSSTFYDSNQKLHHGPTKIPETKESVTDDETNKWLFDLLRGEEPCNATAEDILERNLIRMLILMQFVDMTDLLVDLLYLIDSGYPSTEGSFQNSSAITEDILKRIIQEVFPLVPVKFGTDPTGQSEIDSSITGARELRSDRKTSWSAVWSSSKSDSEGVPREEESRKRPPLDIPEGDPEFSRVRPRIRALLGSRNQKAVEIVKAILGIIGHTSGKISRSARLELVSTYVSYMDSRLNELLKEFQ